MNEGGHYVIKEGQRYELQFGMAKHRRNMQYAIGAVNQGEGVRVAYHQAAYPYKKGVDAHLPWTVTQTPTHLMFATSNITQNEQAQRLIQSYRDTLSSQSLGPSPASVPSYSPHSHRPTRIP